MDYHNLGRQGVKVSPLCLGAMMFGGPTDEADSIRIIARALDAGINFIDTANVYNGGESERIVGKAIKDRRQDIVLATKGRGPMGEGPNDQGAGRGHILKAVDDSLARMDTDYIDLYYIHAPDYTASAEETLGALDDCVRAGKIRYIACSNYYAWQVCEALYVSRENRYASFAAVQPLYNIVNRDPELELLPLCQKYGLGVVSYSPLARGILTGKYAPGAPLPPGSRAERGDKRIQQTELRDESMVTAQALKPLADAHGVGLSQFSLAWALANPILTSVIVGPRTLDQLEDNLGALDVTLTTDDESAVDAIAPKGEHTGHGYNDPQYPVRGR
jgi:aryl-alcohol dehydrogenase-like predicted oxidoreductase